MTRTDAADLIDRFISGNVLPWEWDDFVTGAHSDSEVRTAARQCLLIRDEFPPTAPKAYTSEAGVAALRAVASGLRRLVT
jgi:hypothetical protein